jgi:hypothetical protein
MIGGSSGNFNASTLDAVIGSLWPEQVEQKLAAGTKLRLYEAQAIR